MRYVSSMRSRGLLWLLIVQLLNISVDPPDRLMYANDAAESRSTFNEIESVVELIIESQEEWEELIPENSDAESESHVKTPIQLFMPGSHGVNLGLIGPSFLISRHDRMPCAPNQTLLTPPPEA